MNMEEHHSGAVDAIIMASGFSRRFGGKNKLLEPFRGKALASYTLDLCMSMKNVLRRIFFVVSDLSVAALADNKTGIDILVNKNPGVGQRESVRLGVEASRADYYLFFPADQPFLVAAPVLDILSLKAPGKIVYPVYRDSPGNPVLFSSQFRNDLLSLGEGEKPRILKSRYPHACIEVTVTDSLLLSDIDTVPDLLRFGRSKDNA